MMETVKAVAELPWLAWVFAILLICFVFGLVIWVLKHKDVKIKDVEFVSKPQRELLRTEGKNTLDNQTSNAHNLLKKIWIEIYETGRSMFSIKDQKELFILEDIAHLIEGKLNYEVKNDLTRNHITEKDDTELIKYSDAKAIGYYRSVTANLYSYNVQLPDYDLPKIMDRIPEERFKELFEELYFCARKIADVKS